MAEPRPVIKGLCDALTLGLAQVGEVPALGEILPDEPIGVLVGPPLPGVVGRCEVDLRPEGLLHLFVVMELAAVVGSDRLHPIPLTPEQLDRAPQRLPLGGPGQLADAHQPAPAFDHRHHTGLPPPVHRVDLPVPEPPAALHLRRPLPDHLLSRQATPAVVARVALAPLLARTPQMPPQAPTPHLVRPDPLVDRLVAHRPMPFQTPPSRRLLGAQVPPDHRLDRREGLGTIPQVPPRTPFATPGFPDRVLSPIVPVLHRAIAPHLPVNRAPVPPQRKGDPGYPLPLPPHRRDPIPLLRAHLLIAHKPNLSHLLLESKRPNRPVHLIPCLRHFWHFACGAGSDARSKRDR